VRLILSDGYSYRRFRLIDLNRTPNAIAFCATALRVRRNFFATSGPDSLAFARALKVFTSSFDHARTTRRFLFAIINPQRKVAHCTFRASTAHRHVIAEVNPSHLSQVCQIRIEWS
jgi:hypothetical protein